GATWLAVLNVEEGAWLRREGIRARILVMADYLPEDRGALVEYSLTPVIHSLDDIKTAVVPYHLKIDSGMGRLRTRATHGEIVGAVRAVTAPLKGVMTHFASTANYEPRQTEEQIQRFSAVLEVLKTSGITTRYVHASGTIPVAYGRREAWGNLVRPG